jgi:hypothetical protein
VQSLPSQERQRLLAILRLCTHITEVERPRYQRHLNPINNEPIGVQFLLKEVDEEAWKAALARDEKEREKSNEIRDVLDAFLGAAIDLFNRIERGKRYGREEASILVKSILTEFEALRAFSMEAMTGISHSFNCSIPFLTPEWEMEHGKPSELVRRAKRREEAMAAIERRREEEEAVHRAAREARRTAAAACFAAGSARGGAAGGAGTTNRADAPPLAEATNRADTPPLIDAETARQIGITAAELVEAHLLELIRTT